MDNGIFWFSVELSRNEAEEFKPYLKGNDIYYEASEADELIHFEVHCSESQKMKLNDFLIKLT